MSRSRSCLPRDHSKAFKLSGSWYARRGFAEKVVWLPTHSANLAAMDRVVPLPRIPPPSPYRLDSPVQNNAFLPPGVGARGRAVQRYRAEAPKLHHLRQAHHKSAFRGIGSFGQNHEPPVDSPRAPLRPPESLCAKLRTFIGAEIWTMALGAVQAKHGPHFNEEFFDHDPMKIATMLPELRPELSVDDWAKLKFVLQEHEQAPPEEPALVSAPKKPVMQPAQHAVAVSEFLGRLDFTRGLVGDEGSGGFKAEDFVNKAAEKMRDQLAGWRGAKSKKQQLHQAVRRKQALALPIDPGDEETADVQLHAIIEQRAAMFAELNHQGRRLAEGCVRRMQHRRMYSAWAHWRYRYQVTVLHESEVEDTKASRLPECCTTKGWRPLLGKPGSQQDEEPPEATQRQECTRQQGVQQFEADAAENTRAAVGRHHLQHDLLLAGISAMHDAHASRAEQFAAMEHEMSQNQEKLRVLLREVDNIAHVRQQERSRLLRSEHQVHDLGRIAAPRADRRRPVAATTHSYPPRKTIAHRISTNQGGKPGWHYISGGNAILRR